MSVHVSGLWLCSCGFNRQQTANRWRSLEKYQVAVKELRKKDEKEREILQLEATEANTKVQTSIARTHARRIRSQ
jgi:hypothetical protein